MLEFLKTTPSVWEYLKNCGEPVVLYGMGDGADKVLAAFEGFGIEAAGVMASDGFVRGQSFHGFTVKTRAQLERELGVFTVALCFATQLPDVMQTVKQVAAAHVTVVPSVPAFGSRLFDRAFAEEYADEINAARRLLADGQSRRVYDGVLRFYHTGRLELLDEITTDKSEAFGDILRLGDNELYVDLGAYNGDTIDEFLKYSGGSYRRVVALEPNAKNFGKLSAHCADMERVELWQLGAWNENTALTFNNKAGRNSAISEKGVQTRVARVDTVLCGAAASYIKADVEGADAETLLGMTETLKNHKPKLNFAAYHRFEDIFKMPLLIHRLNPDYKIYLRHHPYIPAWDTNLYCV